MSQPKPTPESQSPHRLPCRGCMRDCPNYATCGGAPWRPKKV